MKKNTVQSPLDKTLELAIKNITSNKHEQITLIYINENAY